MTNDEATINLGISKYMHYGLEVYDVERKRVGIVADYDLRAGYMTVRCSTLSETVLYIPFSTITHIDPRELFVSKFRDELHGAYSYPPLRSATVEKRVDVDTGDDDSVAIISEPSGYGDAPVVVERTNIGRLAHHIALGYQVYTVDMEDIGTIKRYDHETGQMLVERGLFHKRTFVVPAALVDLVDRNERRVYLAVSSTDLRQAQVSVRKQKPDAKES